MDTKNHFGLPAPFVKAANQSITVDGIPFVYRDLGPKTEVPLVVFNHWGAVLNNFDPRVIDGLAKTRRVIATDFRGIGGSGGHADFVAKALAFLDA